jgi:hypothetical protein
MVQAAIITMTLTRTKAPLLWQRGLVWLAFLGPFFFLSYGWVNHFTSGRNDVGVLVEAWERNIPFVPWLMLPYMSIDAFYALSLLLFRKRKALDRHAFRLLLATIISIIGFLLFPLKFTFVIPKAEGFNGALQSVLFGFDKPYNQAPSLHISLLIILWVVYAKKLQGFARLVIHGWFLAIAASVLLVYQHHFIDVWTGALVGLFCLYLIPDLPFSWYWKSPTLRMKSIALRYAGAALLLLTIGLLFRHLLASIIFVWATVALSLVSAAYFGFERQTFQRQAGNMRWPARILLAPYLFGNWISYRFYTKNRTLPNKIHGKVWLGAFPGSAAKTIVNWFAVLDMTNEFHRPPVTSSALRLKFLPVMDLTPPCVQTLVRATRWLERQQQQGDVLVHCALGLSRSASVVVCWLVWQGHASNVQVAINYVNALRSGIVLNPEHLRNIGNALNILDQKDKCSG